jgi:hypothetical protein
VVDCLALAQKNWIGTGSSIKTPYPLYAVGNTQTLALTFMFPDDGAGVTCASFENGEEEFNTFLEEDWCFFGGFLERPKRKQ